MTSIVLFRKDLRLDDHPALAHAAAILQTGDPGQWPNRGVILGRDYPTPLVDHQLARDCGLEDFATPKKQL